MDSSPSNETSAETRNLKFWLWDFSFKPVVLFIIMAVLYGAISFPFERLSFFLKTSFLDSILLQKSMGLISTITAISVINFFVFIFLKKQTLSQSPLGLKNLLKELWSGFLLGAGVFTIVILISWMMGIYSVSSFYWNEHSSLDTLVFILTNLLFFLSVGLFEEYIFRAGMFQLIEETWGTWAALIISSFFFGYVHLNNPHSTLIGVIGIMFEAGIFLGSAYMLTRKIWFVAGIHWSWNFFQGPVLGNIISGSTTTQEGLLMSKMNGSEILTGGIFRREAGLPAIVICSSVGIYFLVKAKKSNLFKKSLL